MPSENENSSNKQTVRKNKASPLAPYAEGADLASDITTGAPDLLGETASKASEAPPLLHSAPDPTPTPTDTDTESPLIHDFKEAAHITFFLNFGRGVYYTWQAFKAWRNNEEPQRKTKIAAGIFGGVVCMTAGILGPLLLFHAGLLATSAALAITPIVIAAAIIGVYSVMLYRDSYILYQTNKLISNLQREVDQIDKELAEIRLNKAPQFQREFVLIAQKSNLNSKLSELYKVKKAAKRSVIINAISTVGTCLVLGAVLATGIGAIIFTGAAIAATGITLGVRLGQYCYNKYQSYKLRKANEAAKQAATIKSQQNNTTPAPKLQQTPTSGNTKQIVGPWLHLSKKALADMEQTRNKPKQDSPTLAAASNPLTVKASDAASDSITVTASSTSQTNHSLTIKIDEDSEGEGEHETPSPKH